MCVCVCARACGERGVDERETASVALSAFVLIFKLGQVFLIGG